MGLDFKTLFKRKESDSLDSEVSDLEEDNTSTRNRNFVIVSVLLAACGISVVAFKMITAPPYVAPPPDPEYEPVITTDFTARDTQSALQAQQQTIVKMQENINQLLRQRDGLSEEIQRGMDKLNTHVYKALEDAKSNFDDKLEVFKEQWQQQAPPIFPNMEDRPLSGEQGSTDVNGTVNPNPFGEPTPQYQSQPYPRFYDKPELKDKPVSKRQGFQTFTYSWPKAGSQTVYRRTSKNYVPTGSFVTAVLIGAADANAGVNAQGDTAPILFRTIHNGILPNGKRSHLKGCFVTASVYGEISSNRGIARLQRMSCIFDKKGKEEILDIPVRGTAFSFGRNGMRGTPVMRNGKIMQMAGISGLFTGLGDTAKATSSTNITSPSGVVSTINPSQALLNMSGSALENVGSKLSDYYIKLAEQYHPIIELNPGSVVNLVFLEGFPLDSDKIAEYENRISDSSGGSENVRSMVSQMMNSYLNPMSPMPLPMLQGQPQQRPTNPLINQLPPSLQKAAEQYNQTQQVSPSSNQYSTGSPY